MSRIEQSGRMSLRRTKPPINGVSATEEEEDEDEDEDEGEEEEEEEEEEYCIPLLQVQVRKNSLLRWEGEKTCLNNLHDVFYVITCTRQ